MKKYYLTVNGSQLGPLTLEELKSNTLKKKTMVWFEGLIEWKEAGTIEELSSLFNSIPPPINIPPSINSNKSNLKKEKQSIFRRYRNGIIIGVTSTLLVLFFYSFSGKQNYNEHARDVTRQRIELRQNINNINLYIGKSQNALDEANKNLAKAKEFVLFRSQSKKNDQINSINNDISIYTNKLLNLNLQLAEKEEELSALK
jgi:hypothetical protein